jgi:hypothetical protein
LLAACGSASSNLFDPPSAQTSPSLAASGGSAGSAVTSAGANSIGGSEVGVAGTNSVAGTSSVAGSMQIGSAGSSGMMMGSGNGTCGPAKDVSGGSSGELATMGPACLRVTGMIAGWGCSNFDGRTVEVNGQDVTCGEIPLPAPIDGAYYFDISAGMFDYASFYWF